VERRGRIPDFVAPSKGSIVTFPAKRFPDWERKAYASAWLKLPVREGRVMLTVEVDKADDKVSFWITDIRQISTGRDVVAVTEEAPLDVADTVEFYTERRVRLNNPARSLPMSRHPSLTALYIVLDDINALLPDEADPQDYEMLAERCREIDVPDDSFAEARHECCKALRAGRGDIRKELRAIADFRDYAEMRIAIAGRAAVSDFDARMARFQANKREGNPGGHSTGMLIASGVGGFVVGAMVTGAAYNSVVVKPLFRRVIELSVTKQPGTV
jgi:hypothetical protein